MAAHAIFQPFQEECIKISPPAYFSFSFLFNPFQKYRFTEPSPPFFSQFSSFFIEMSETRRRRGERQTERVQGVLFQKVSRSVFMVPLSISSAETFFFHTIILAPFFLPLSPSVLQSLLLLLFSVIFHFFLFPHLQTGSLLLSSFQVSFPSSLFSLRKKHLQKGQSSFFPP